MVCLYSPSTFKLLTIHLLHPLLLLHNIFATDNNVGDLLILYFFAKKNKPWMHCMQVRIMMNLSKNVHLILASYLTFCLFLALDIFIYVKEDLYNMDVFEPPGIPGKTKMLPPKQKKAQNGIGARGGISPARASYAAAVINAPSYL